EFEKYKLIPEYQQINKGMSLAEFQFIYWWEWAHRFLGRIIGFAFALPLVYFWATGRLENKLKPRLLILLFLGGLQGFIGWWMVSSGLVERTDVSQYRLAIHLTLACIIFAYALWIARGLVKHTTHESVPRTLPLLAIFILVLAIVQIFLGGLVAGLDAGLTYNTWPLMDGALVPQGRDVLSPLWLNWFENPKAVQFNHRIGAYVLLLSVFVQFVLTLKSGVERQHFNRSIVVLSLVLAQALVGIITLLMQVPIDWALVHQGLAVIFLASCVAHLRGFYGAYPAVTNLEIRG
ncbi:MAG: COX15/CtaA family protein, partial [Nitratireductor sp.]